MKNIIKKMLAVGLCFTALTPNAIPVLAVDTTVVEDNNKAMFAKYKVASHYKWSIHSAIDFGTDAGPNNSVVKANNQINVLENVIPGKKYLNINVRGDGVDGAFTLTNGKSETLSYDISNDTGNIAVDGNVLSVPAGTDTATQNVSFKLNTKKSSAEVAGNYNGHVVYNAEIGGKNGLKEKSSVIIGTIGSWFEEGPLETLFADAIPKAATSIAFTDEVAPKGVSTTDLTVAKDNGVVGWLDGTTWKVSTQDPSRAVVFNENCFCMFATEAKLMNISFDNVDTSTLTNMSGLFAGYGGNALDFSKLDTSNVTDMSFMFSGGGGGINPDFSKLNTSKVTNMAGMFESYYGTKLDLSTLNTSHVTNMAAMFNECRNLEKLDISGFDTSHVTNMTGMFACSPHIKRLNLSHFDTSKVTSMRSMFDMDSVDIDKSELVELDLSSFDTSNVTDMNGMFSCCVKLETIYVGDKWTTKNVVQTDYDWNFHRDDDGAFAYCYLLPNYNSATANSSSAHTGPGGYLTLKQ